MHDTGSGHREGEPADVHRVQTVDVLVRVDLEQRGVEVDLRRSGVLHEITVDGRVGVEVTDRRDQVGLGRVVGEVDVRRAPAELLRLPLLDPDVALARGVAPDEDRAEPERVARLAQRLDARHEIREHGLRDRRAGHHHGAHQCRKCRSPVNTIASPSSSARAMICSSLIRPPGCTTTATPADAAASTPSGNG